MARVGGIFGTTSCAESRNSHKGGDAMKQVSLLAGLIIGVLSLLIACESKKEAAKPVGDAALISPAGSAGRMENDEGVGHNKQGHWTVAEGHFRKAIAADTK